MSFRQRSKTQRLQRQASNEDVVLLIGAPEGNSSHIDFCISLAQLLRASRGCYAFRCPALSMPNVSAKIRGTPTSFPVRRRRGFAGGPFATLGKINTCS